MGTPASYVAKPSRARRIALDCFVPVPRGAAAVVPPPLNWPTKDPADILDYELDISAALTGNDGDKIATLDVTIAPANPGDLTTNSAAADGSVIVIWMSGGQAGTVYVVTVLISTTSGRTLQRSILLPVLSLSTPPVPPASLQTETGLIITDQNGNPVLSS